MNHAEQLNMLIDIASRRTDFQTMGYRSFDQENQANLGEALRASNLFFTTSVLGMEAISHVIEDQAINLGGKFDFYSGFQKFSRFAPQEERYKKLCQTGNTINVFGIPDTELKNDPNLRAVVLPKKPTLDVTSLAHNWFVVLNNPKFVSMALIASEQTRSKLAVRHPNKLVYRNFEGFWTYNQTIINEVVGILDDYIATFKTNPAQII